MNKFIIKREFNPTPNQQTSIDSLTQGMKNHKFQTFKGITGSGKTYVMANVINNTNHPSIVMAPNKVLAYQLYNELRQLFPDNFVGYYVSNYDLYKPAFFSDVLDAKVDGKVIVNQANKILRYEVKDFLELSEHVILVCSSTIIFPTYKEDIISLVQKHKNYIIRRLNEEKVKQVASFYKCKKKKEAERLESIIDHTISSMMQDPEYVNINMMGILNEKVGDFYLTDYFKDKKPNLFIDESHLTLLQLESLPKANVMRISKLINKGYYISNVLKNNILNFQKLVENIESVVFVSATPSEYELGSSGNVVELLTRPNDLIDPEISCVDSKYFGSKNMIDDIKNIINKNETIFINCISRNSVNEMEKYLNDYGIETEKIHFKIMQDKRKNILRDLRDNKIKVILGINMLREGLDVKSCSLVIVEQADKNNFLRTKTCLIQIAGRASRNKNGKVIMCRNKMVKPLIEAIDEINKRREIQIKTINEKRTVTTNY